MLPTVLYKCFAGRKAKAEIEYKVQSK